MPREEQNPPSETLIGKPLPRAEARRLGAGRGTYVDDISLPGMLHMALLRSPYAHARIIAIDTTGAAAAPGVHRVITGAEMAGVCQPLVAKLDFAPGMISAPQHALAVDEVAWQGEAVCAVLAASRAQAEDAAELIEVSWRELPVVATPAAALAPGAPPVHSALESNLALEMPLSSGDVEAVFEEAAVVVEHDFAFGRQTGVSLETRALIADWEPHGRSLKVHQSHQAPFQMQDVYARHLDLPEHRVRVIAPDVGGAFGVKLHAYADELAAVAASVMTGRPVKYVADRWEALLADIHAREMTVAGRLALDAEGRIVGLSVDVLSAVGAYSIYPRTSVGEGIQAAQFAGLPYRVPAFWGRVRVVYQNKAPTGALRAVGMPVGCAVTETLLDMGAVRLGLDAAEIRRRNYLGSADLPAKSPGGLELGPLSLDACLEKLLVRMDYDGLRRQQAELRKKGIWRGIGLATFVEQTGVGAGLYGPAGVRVSAQEGCTLRLDPSGLVRCTTSVTDQGQGTLTGIAQVVAETLGVRLEEVTVEAGDGGATPYGGGTWASRGLALGGEAGLLAARDLRARILVAAGALLQRPADSLELASGAIRAADGASLMALSELARIVHFRQDTLPPDAGFEMMVSRHFVPRRTPYFMANGIQASYLEVDVETGQILLLGHWVVDDCGRVVNPLQVDEQLRGGIVQGLGAVLYEHCIYDDQGQLLTGTLADYMVPLASEMPDIDVAHVETPVAETELGAKGVGEAGMLGAPGAVWTALHDALAPLGGVPRAQPFTPARVLEALGE
ncbi:MAG: xanthine dehydrogenase family protein molybdopterin-binding subunit [Alphaproteobacteria bacterium]|nr:xanthine dehydrogenase family protein molybdopterin-binding subunit [Alphaproteobacteria bacterium]